MAIAKLTDGVVEAIAPAGADQYLWDSELRRFGVRVTPAGARLYMVQYRTKAVPGERSKTRKIMIGRHDGKLWNVTKARAAARKLLAPVDLDRDPFGEREAELAAAARAAEAEAAEAARLAEAARERELGRFEVVAERYIEARLKDSRSGQETARLLRTGPVAAWKGKHVAEVRRRDVADFIDATRKRSAGVARLTYAALRGLYGWCIERDLVDASPCDHLKAPPRCDARDRVLADSELRAIWRACDGLGYPFGPVVRLLMLTGQRRAEVAGMAWSEVDLEAGVWRIPRERTKNGRAHEVDLGPEAVAILAAIPREGSLVFPATRAPARKGDAAGVRPEDPGAVRGFSATKRRLDELAKAEGHVASWRLHDLRRTAATGMAGMEVSPHVIERVLNHVSGVQGGLVGVYQRFDYRAGRKAALLAWGAHVAVIVAGQSDPSPVEPADAPAEASSEALALNVVRLRA